MNLYIWVTRFAVEWSENGILENKMKKSNKLPRMCLSADSRNNCTKQGCSFAEKMNVGRENNDCQRLKMAAGDSEAKLQNEKENKNNDKNE